MSDTVDELIEKINNEFGEDFKVDEHAHAPTAHRLVEMNTIPVGLYLNELVENGNCLCGLPLFFPKQPSVDIYSLDFGYFEDLGCHDDNIAYIEFDVYCRRDHHQNFESISFNVAWEGPEELQSRLLYSQEIDVEAYDGARAEINKKCGRIRSEGWQKLIALYDPNSFICQFFQFYKKFTDTTGEYVKLREGL